eukprot:TRINITY_DN12549_c1_g1_i1.p1 TRINITY_DN12549_c1_g1~~TRINITY_DN12549_c1_g1_i1.p1  ORF type:complete len:238 (-),score=60.39 TRINITY_DN12549_c1_g1_i1:339-1052(-)
MTNELVTIQPGELRFPFELKKQTSCSLQLVNNTESHVAFKVKTTSPKKYCVRPNTGVIEPKATCEVTVTMQAQKDAPPDYQCKDKFLVQSVIAPEGVTVKDITTEMFNKEAGRIVEENKLRVIYIPPSYPSVIQESSEEGTTVKASGLDNATAQGASPADQLPRDVGDLKSKYDHAMSAIAKLTEEKNSAIQQRQQLLNELEVLQKNNQGRNTTGFSFLFVCFVALIGIVIGYFFNS